MARPKINNRPVPRYMVEDGAGRFRKPSKADQEACQAAAEKRARLYQIQERHARLARSQ